MFTGNPSTHINAMLKERGLLLYATDLFSGVQNQEDFKEISGCSP